MKSKILVVDDEPTVRLLVETHLKKNGYDVDCAADAAQLRFRLSENQYQLIVLDINLPDGDGIEIMQDVHKTAPNVPVIIITANSSIELAVDAMRLGAYDFCQKPIEFNRLHVSVKNALESYKLKKTLANIEKFHRKRFCDIIGTSPEMQVVYQLIENVAPTSASIMITGDSGTGKELVASAIHELSPRKDHEKVDVNCAAIPKELLESELFGHEKAAFTGAARRFIGRFEQANESTIFLDEICEMEIELQAKLLRVLQERSFYRVGGNQKINVDVRLISATNQDPGESIREGRFREDLYYRINVVNIHIPALRERVPDIPVLAEFFLERYANEHNKHFQALGSSAIDALCAYHWPGNVRELQNCIQHSVILNEGEMLEAEMLPVPVRGTATPIAYSTALTESSDGSANGNRRIVPLEQLERRAIEEALKLTQGNVAEAAAGLEVSQTTLYRKIKEFDFALKDYKSNNGE